MFLKPFRGPDIGAVAESGIEDAALTVVANPGQRKKSVGAIFGTRSQRKQHRHAAAIEVLEDVVLLEQIVRLPQRRGRRIRGAVDKDRPRGLGRMVVEFAA